MSDWQLAQLALARHLRDPLQQPPPGTVEPRRIAVYRELVYNAIEGFLSGGFPVLRSLYAAEDWNTLVRGFIKCHRCTTPYFLEISQEFITHLAEEYQPGPHDPPFMAELAHYEWVELALDVAEAEAPPMPTDPDPLAQIPVLSEVAWLLSYVYPVHRIGPGFRPDAPDEPTFLAVYRGRDDAVGFMALNAATARLLELIRDNREGATGAALLQQLALELQMDPDLVLRFGVGLLDEFLVKAIIGLRATGVAPDAAEA